MKHRFPWFPRFLNFAHLNFPFFLNFLISILIHTANNGLLHFLLVWASSGGIRFWTFINTSHIQHFGMLNVWFAFFLIVFFTSCSYLMWSFSTCFTFITNQDSYFMISSKMGLQGPYWWKLFSTHITLKERFSSNMNCMSL
jgi:hypothetical protein